MSEASVYELKRRKAKRMLDWGQIDQAEHDRMIAEANADEQAELRALHHAIKQSRLNR